MPWRLRLRDLPRGRQPPTPPLHSVSQPAAY